MSDFGINTDRPNFGVSNQQQLTETENINTNQTKGLNTDNSLENIEYTTKDKKTESPGKPNLPDPTTKPDESRLDALSSHMPDTKQMTDLYNVMMLFFQVAREGKVAMRQMNMAQAESVLNMGLEAADKMRTAAVLTLVGTVISGAVSIAGGLAGMRAGASGTATAASNAQSILQLSGSTGSTIKGVFDYGAQQELAGQKEDEAYAAKGEAVRQQIKDDAGEMAKYMNAVIDALKEIKQNQEQSLKKIWS